MLHTTCFTTGDVLNFLPICAHGPSLLLCYTCYMLYYKRHTQLLFYRHLTQSGWLAYSAAFLIASLLIPSFLAPLFSLPWKLSFCILWWTYFAWHRYMPIDANINVVIFYNAFSSQLRSFLFMFVDIFMPLISIHVVLRLESSTFTSSWVALSFKVTLSVSE